ncbi:DedA family protein [Haemophilus haemoglobinophilus]|nr:DedA family protein [Canicola haemoglobinophilus]MBN6712321.1 DedA family protein [Canicola haemoglobinophilus]
MEIFSWDLFLEHPKLLMFASAFLSATVLPGNSEVIFVALSKSILFAHGFFSTELWSIIFIATLGNSLGSMTTYWIGCWFPKFSQNRPHFWALDKIKRYGIWVLLLSWLPIVGDMFCALAGWLRLNWLYSAILICIGKFLRYVLLLGVSWGLFNG